MLQAYRQHVAERAALGIPPLPLSAKQTAELIELLKAPPAGEETALVDLHHPPRAGRAWTTPPRSRPATWRRVAHGTEKCALITPAKATELLGTMLGGYNIAPLIDLLDDAGRGRAWPPPA